MGDVTVPAIDWAAPERAHFLGTSLLNSYTSPPVHTVNTWRKVILRQPPM